uniref:IS481 family transposase n=1 Tax=Novosphingobium endophyticum TaxID=1955250 RepID=UPI00166DC156|nr:IS481 family transposase [Novosphingobium endophyticum]
MSQVPRRSARTTEEERRAIRASDESLRILAKRYGINPKTVAKWKKRESADDLPHGPKPGRHRKLTAEEEGMIVQFREHTLLPLDDCLYALQAHIPHLSRSSLHRCLQRHGINRLAEASDVRMGVGQETPPLGDLHIDTSQVRSNDGSHCLFNAIEQSSKFVFVQMGTRGKAADAAGFLAALAERSPLRIERVFTVDAEPFVAKGEETDFARVCRKRGIEHRLTAGPHPWTRARDMRLGRMLLENVTYTSEAYLARMLRDFVHAYNFKRRVKALRGKTPYEFLRRTWAEQPERFLRDPHHDLLRLEFMHV